MNANALEFYSIWREVLKLPECLQDSRWYDWNLAREFANCQKQVNSDSDYLLSEDERNLLDEIEAYIILKESGNANNIDSSPIRDGAILILEQRIEIRDAVLTNENFHEIDNRLPLELLPNQDAARIYKLINPDGCKDWNLPLLLPVGNLMENQRVPCDELLVAKEGIQPSSEPVANQSIADGQVLENYHLPIDGFGKLAKSVIGEYSQAFRVPKDMIAAMLLPIVGAAANKKVRLISKNFVNYAAIWVAIVERSGGGKSEPQSRLEKPLRDINNDLNLQYKKIYADWASSGSKGTPPTKRKLIVDDSTPEILYQLLAAGGLYLSREELSGLFADFGRYHQGSELERYLTIFSNKDFSIDRVTGASFEVQRPFMCVLGGVQPERLAEAFGKKDFEPSGFLARWLFAISPDSKVPDSASEKVISRDIENQWYNLIVSLWRMEPRDFRVTPDAWLSYQGYMKKTAAIMNAENCEDGICTMYAKLRIIILRIALILHLLKYGDKADDLIDRKTMDLAVLTTDCFAYWGIQARSLIKGTAAKKDVSNAQLLRLLCERYNVQNQSELARLINRSQQYVSRILNDK